MKASPIIPGRNTLVGRAALEGAQSIFQIALPIRNTVGRNRKPEARHLPKARGGDLLRVNVWRQLFAQRQVLIDDKTEAEHRNNECDCFNDFSNGWSFGSCPGFRYPQRCRFWAANFPQLPRT
jgi:hypothetical protein